MFAGEASAQERRKDEYNFPSLKSLKNYFGLFLPVQEMEAAVALAKEGFRGRQGCDAKTTELQFVKLCEAIMFKRLLARSPASESP